MVTEIKEKNWFRRHWIISIFLGFIFLGMFGSIFDSGGNSDITGNDVNEQVPQLQLTLQTYEGGLEEFPTQVTESIENSKVFDYWKSINKEKVNFLYYSSEDYETLLNTFESESLNETIEKICGNKLSPQEMIISSEEDVILKIRVSDGKIMCDVVLTKSIQEESKACVPKWNCGSWSECDASEIQTRTCTDLNNCGTNSGKPQTSQSCIHKECDLEMSLNEIFNIFSKLSEIQQEEKIKEFKGKRIKTSIYASKIDKASLSTQYVVMEMYDYPYSLSPYAKAFFPNEEKNNLLRANIGDTIVFSGEFVTYHEGALTSYVEFTKSRFIEVK